jgi:hypothetical protein
MVLKGHRDPRANRATKVGHHNLVSKQIPGANPLRLIGIDPFERKDLDKFASPAVNASRGRDAVADNLVDNRVHDWGKEEKQDGDQSAFHPSQNRFNFFLRRDDTDDYDVSDALICDYLSPQGCSLALYLNCHSRGLLLRSDYGLAVEA